MDSNLRIIKLVKRRPVLYTKCNDFRERDYQWEEIANILGIDASLCKSRWHLLREKFTQEYSSALKGVRSTFKYFEEMAFLANHINVEAFEMLSKPSGTQPEFVITEKDIENDSEDDSTDKFIEIELGDDSHQEFAQIPFEAPDDASQNEYVKPIYIEDYSNNSAQSEVELEMSPNNNVKQRKVELFLEVKASDSGASDKICTKDDSNGNNEKKDNIETNEPDFEEKLDKTEKCEPKNDEEVVQSVVENPMPSNKIENYRCEDTIFGELVTATLREMTTDKKKAVKRQIMNILFT